MVAVVSCSDKTGDGLYAQFSTRLKNQIADDIGKDVDKEIIIGNCLDRYSKPTSFSDGLKKLFWKVVNAAKALFGSSDWQKALSILAQQYPVMIDREKRLVDLKTLHEDIKDASKTDQQGDLFRNMQALKAAWILHDTSEDPDQITQIGNCLDRYSRPTSFSETLRKLFWKVVNGVKSLFGKSDWQLTHQILNDRYADVDEQEERIHQLIALHEGNAASINNETNAELIQIQALQKNDVRRPSEEEMGAIGASILEVAQQTGSRTAVELAAMAIGHATPATYAVWATRMIVPYLLNRTTGENGSWSSTISSVYGVYTRLFASS